MWDFKGQELVVTFVNITFIPLIQQVVLPFNDDTDGGAELEVIKYLSKVLNFRIKLVPSVDGFWGSKTEDGWNGMVGMVARGEADMAFGSISDTQERRGASIQIQTITLYSSLHCRGGGLFMAVC